MDLEEFLEKLASVKTVRGWYRTHRGEIRCEVHLQFGGDPIAGQILCCPITAVGGGSRPINAHSVGRDRLGMENSLICSIVAAADNPAAVSSPTGNLRKRIEDATIYNGACCGH